MPKAALWTALIAILSLLSSAHQCIAAPTFQQRQAAKSLADAIGKAGMLYKDGKFKESADAIRKIQEDFDSLVKEGDADLLKMVKPIYDRLKTAHSLLELEGYKLPALSLPSASSTPKPIPGTPKPKSDGVSFVSQVAPLLVGKCGGCHVNKASGKFSMENYATLMKGPTAGVVIFPGKPDGSRLIEVIEGGEMPPNGRGPSAQELAILKTWITEGAKFDGEAGDVELSLNRFSSGSPPPTATVAKPTGNESVSFANHVAPVLVENCSGCHVNAQRVRGGLNMTTFQNMLRGGDTGPIIVAGKPDTSLLIGKLKGTAENQRMPPSGPLPDDVIAVIEKWVAEGAKFDGPDPNDTVDKVAALAKAKNSTHEELSADRAAKSEEYWRITMSGAAPTTVETENFLVIGNVGENTLNDFAKKAELMVHKIRKMFSAPSNEPLIKGRSTLFIFQQRYDYSEFGKMVERRDIPNESRGHWRFSVVDAYGAIVPGREDEYSSDVLIGQQIAGNYIASLGKLPPRWFAEGAARVAASRLDAKDPRVKEWDDGLGSVLASMKEPDDFLKGKLSPEQADIANYSFVKGLMKNNRSFLALLNRLREDEDFDKAFTTVYGGSPSQLAAAWVRYAK